MAAELNHTIVWSSDQTMSARFLAEMLGRPAPTRFGHFDVVELDNGVSLDFADTEGPIRPQHYAFLISEADLDRKSTRLNSSHANISYAVFCLKKKNQPRHSRHTA